MIIDVQYVFLALSVIAVLFIAFIAYQISELSYKFARMPDLTLDELAKISSQISRLEVWLERISLDMEYISTKAREEE